MTLEDLSLAEARSAIRDGSLSPVQYAAALFARMDQVEPQVHAWVTVDRNAVFAEARKCEAEAQKKQFRGPLHGIPIGIKDIFYTKNLRTTMCSPVFDDFIPKDDAWAVARLREAGAVIMGKCVTTMFANLDPGPTRNPWNLAHTPGGSSSGSAAAVAARMCPAAIGTQTLGSVGRPAAFNGVASLVPTQRRISRRGVFPLAWSLDHVGVFGRSVDDIELMFTAMTGFPIERLAGRRGIRIGIMRDFFYEKASPETRLHCDRLAREFTASGFQVDVARPPAVFSAANSALQIIVQAEAASVHERLFAEHAKTYANKIRTVIEAGMRVSATDYLRARRTREKYQRDMAKLFEKFDVLMTPAAPGTAPEGLATTGDPVMNAPWTLADFPTVTLPFALGSNGLPLAVQLSGAPLQEGSLLQAAKMAEDLVDFRAKPNL